MIGLLLILGLAAGLRLYDINASSFWLDEFCSVETSTGRGLAHVALPTTLIGHSGSQGVTVVRPALVRANLRP